MQRTAEEDEVVFKLAEDSEELLAMEKKSPDDPFFKVMLAYSFQQNDPEQAKQWLQKAETMNLTDKTLVEVIASVYMAVGDKAKAFMWADKAIAKGSRAAMIHKCKWLLQETPLTDLAEEEAYELLKSYLEACARCKGLQRYYELTSEMLESCPSASPRMRKLVTDFGDHFRHQKKIWEDHEG